MKRQLFILLFFLGVIPSYLQAETERHFTCRTTEQVRIVMDGFSLVAERGSLKHDTEITVTQLSEKSIPPFPSIMENVTARGAGIRLLPDGEHFSKDTPASITLAYDPALIPMGYTAEDIYTFFFNDTTWQRLERVAIDTAAHTITSVTTHFTDFANAVIQVPEMPGSKAFVPTMMTDLPEVNSLQGIPMIAVPTPNNHGTAELTYPIELPAGRQGMQPNIDLHYSSAGGNGLLGVGWDLPLPAVTIDTRWGVPRYDLRYETEAYLVNGEPILLHDAVGDPLPLPHQSADFQARSSQDTRFYARDTRNANVYARHGQTTSRYWWTMTDTDGRTYYYGYDIINDTIDENSILRTADGHIGYWALTYIVDPYGNYIKYTNFNFYGDEILLTQIDYTGHLTTGLPPIYHVYLRYTSRSDKMTDGRLGLLRTCRSRLCHIQLTYTMNNVEKQICAYRMMFKYGAATLFKNRLQSITKIDHDIIPNADCFMSPQSIINNDTTGYWIIYEEKIPDLPIDLTCRDSLPGSVTHFDYGDATTTSTLFATSQNLSGSKSNLSHSMTENWSLGGAATIGFGENPAMTILSGGVNYDYSHSTGSVKTMLMDLNGDGLPDQVYEENGSVYYKKQNTNGSFALPVLVQGLSCLTHDVSSTHTFGAQLDFTVNLSYNPSITNSYTDIYFADVNGDGLPDWITPNGISINHLSSAGHPQFTAIDDQVTNIPSHGNNCQKGVVFDGEVDERLDCRIEKVLVDAFPLDTILPIYDGLVSFINDSTKDTYDSEEGIYIPTNRKPLSSVNKTGADNFEGPESAVKAIGVSSISSFMPSHVESRLNSYPIYDSLSIWYPGDDYSFNLYNDTIWVYQLRSICEKEQAEPNVDIVRVWVSDRNNLIRIQSSIQLIEDTSTSRKQSRDADGVRSRIQGRFILPTYPISENNVLLSNDTIDADDYSVHNREVVYYVRPGDILFFRLSANQDRRFDNVHWEQTIKSIDGTVLYNSARDYICTDEQRFRAPQAGMVRVIVQHQNTNTVPVTVHVKNNYSTPSDTIFTTSSVMHTDTTDWFVVPADSMVHIALQYSGTTEPQWSNTNVSAVIEYATTFMRPDSTTVSDTTRYYPSVQIPYSSYVVNSDYKKLFGPLHKGWGQFAYNDVNGDNLILFNTLHNGLEETADYMNNHTDLANYADTFNIATDTVAGALDARFDSLHIYDPFDANNRWVPMLADPRTNTWMAYGNVGRLGQHLHSTSRMVSRDVMPTETDMLEYDSPIPAKESESNRITYIRKQTHSVQHGATSGIGAGFVNWGESFSWGDHEVRGDYMDLNGDGFPDYIGRNSVQYSNPWGGIGTLQPLEARFSNSFGSGGANFGAAKPMSVLVPNNTVTAGKYMNAGVGGSASGTIGSDMTNMAFIDMNADGLPDIVDAHSARVRYSLGYSFTDWYYIPNLAISGSTHTDGAVSVNLNGLLEKISDVHKINNVIKDFSLAQYSISGGISESASLNHTDRKLVDVNGDGYPDLITHSVGSNTASVQLFDGTQLLSPQTLNINDIYSSATGSVAVNLGVTMGWDWVPLPIKFCFGIHSTPYGCSSTTSNSELVDMNGDGFIDLVSSSDNGLKVRYNKNGNVPVNLLTRVINPTGQKIYIDYSLSEPTIDHRGRTWVMTDLRDEIPYGIDDSYRHEWAFQYNNAHYDNHERTDYGFGRVGTIDNNLKYVEESYLNDLFINRGKKSSDILGSIYGPKFIEHRYNYAYHDRHDSIVWNPCSIADANLFLGEEYCYTDYYEGAAVSPITTAYKLTYDDLHRVIRHEDYGDIAVSGDGWTQVIQYMPRWQVACNQIFSPKVERILDAGGNTIRKSRVNYSDYGKPQQIIHEDTIVPLKAMTTILYDVYGNVGAICYPHNLHMERTWLEYHYDSPTQSHPIRIRNPFGEETYMDYDLRWGRCIRTIDPAGNEMRWRYDRMGRLVDIVAPQELQDNVPFSIHYSYRLPFHDLYTQNPCQSTYEEGIHYVYRLVEDNTDIQEVSIAIYDARGQKLQTKSRQMAEGQIRWVTDGIALRDPWYRVGATCLPSIDQAPLLTPDVDTTGRAVTYRDYDTLDRPTKLRHPDGDSIMWDYGFGVDFNNYRRLFTQQIDENGITTESFIAPQGWVTLSVAGDGSKSIFSYNPLGELISSTDADHYTTQHEYNMFGWRTKRIHPDAGESRWTYDPAGNVIQEQTARHLQDSTHISYNYCFDKLISIHYPFIPTNDVSYIYDAAGRLAYWEDGTGSTSLYYDRLGNVETTLRHIVLPTENYAYNFRTETHYDSFGRIKSILYPDGEEVQYQYYLGGRLQNIKGYRNSNLLHNIIDYIDYDAQGKKKEILYSNGICSQYRYSPQRNWLQHLLTKNLSITLQDIDYSYDHVGNITDIEQHAMPIGSMGGDYYNQYYYDQQYRLTYVDGHSPYFLYDFAMSYSASGRIGNRYCHNAFGVAESRSLYGYDAAGLTHQPRVVYDTLTSHSKQFIWDANGNLAQTFDCNDGAVRFHQWDDINRLRMVLGPTQGGFYGYDANGDRVYKLFGDCDMVSLDRIPTGPFLANITFSNAVLYPNPYISITCQGYTKHYFAGNERVASSEGNGQWIEPAIVPLNDHDEDIYGNTFKPYKDDFPLGNDDYGTLGTNLDINHHQYSDIQYCTEPVALERVSISAKKCLSDVMFHFAEHTVGDEEIYYYHSDHLGSASWITAGNGKPIQYIHYLPYGEILANQTPHGYDERFKFTGKELDAESGYYYFGARYLMSELGDFISTDPHLDARPRISSYAYCSWNPINKTDPDGMDDEQRQAAVDLANKYVEKNPNKSPELYELGAKKGKPGEPIDCSGLGSNCAKAGGEKDPNYGPHSSGVRNIVDNTQKIEDMNDIEAGNFVMFNNNSHMGVVTDVTRDENGNVVDFLFVHSATSTGPIKNGYMQSKYWKNRVCGFYKWDTRPDTYEGPVLPQITAWGSKPNGSNLIRTFNVKPISININPGIRR